MNESNEKLITDLKGLVNGCSIISTSTLITQWQDNLAHYLCWPIKGDDKIKGESLYVAPVTQTRVDWFRSSVTRILAGQKQVVAFTPVSQSPEDVEAARQRDRVVTHVLKERSSHISILSPWIWSAGLYGLGITTVDFRESIDEGLEKDVEAVDDARLAQLVKEEEDGEIIIISRSEDYRPEVPQEILDQASQLTGTTIDQSKIAEMLPLVRDLKIRRIKKTPIFDFKFIGVENVIFSDDATFDQNTGGVKSDIQGYREYQDKETLIELGFKKELINDLAFAYTNNQVTNLMDATTGMFNNQKKSNKVEVWRIWTKMKIEDKKARHYKITIAGDILNNPTILDYEECTSTYPLAVMAPFPLANRIYGQGVGSRTSREQDMISKIQRGTINNLNYILDPMKVVDPSRTTIEDLLNPYPGKTIRSEDPEGGIKYNTPPYVAGSALPVADMLNQTIDNSIGVGGQLTAIDASDLQDVTATAARQRKSTQETLIEDVTRFLAETGYRYLARIIIDQMAQKPTLANLYLSKLFGEETQIIVDDAWELEMDVVAVIDYGMMDRAEKIGTLTNILGFQQQGQGTVATPNNVYQTLLQLSEASGIQNPSLYFTDPSQIPPPPPPGPSPDMQMAMDVEKLKAQNEAVKIEMEAALETKKQEYELLKLQIETDLKRDQMAQDLELKKAEIEAKYNAQVNMERIRIEQEKVRTDYEWAMEQLAAQNEREAERQKRQAMEQEAEMQAQQIAEQMAMAQQMPEQTPPMGM
ncbi:hypothetical protein G6M86_21000 [Agrobacterium tumefaciens]|uniref:Portal protein n=1 Tax=Agrobacterium tumefaciens TaxID=358 RepID=A0AAJ4N5P5_AGRTU|nr:hypothetical protein G6M86_21000 [Agrobacterium tumefaciens]